MKKIIINNELISAYLDHSKAVVSLKTVDENAWARDKVHKIVYDDPDKGFELTIELLKKCKDEKILAYIAAGPLEDLLVWHGKLVLDRLIEAADSDAQIQLALSGVWLDKKDDIYYDWKGMMKKYGFTGEEPRRKPL